MSSTLPEYVDTGELTELPDPLENVARQLLIAIGEDPNREGLRETPARYARWWREFTGYDPGNIETVFQSVSSGQIVEVNNIRVWSICEHHLLPFSCEISIAYVATDRLLGLSKFARIAHEHAHRLQIQERLTSDIAEAIQACTGSANVAVRVMGEHLCMIMRGIRTEAQMRTSVFRGVFETDPEMRARLT